jgi:polyisoprenoid-binding protein YceI
VTTGADSARTVDGIRVPPAGRWVFEAGNSEITFSVKHLVISKVRGSFKQFNGEIVVTDDFWSSNATASIQAASVDTGMAPRDKDLRGPDFLNAEQHPTLDFVSTGLTATRKGWEMTGELTITGQTRPVRLAVEFAGIATDPWGHTKAVFSASTALNREEFGLTYNKVIEGGGVLIGSDVQIEIEIQANPA